MEATDKDHLTFFGHLFLGYVKIYTEYAEFTLMNWAESQSLSLVKAINSIKVEPW